MSLYQWTGTPVKARLKKRMCCVVCGWPYYSAVHLPSFDSPQDKPFDHHFAATANEAAAIATLAKENGAP